MKTTALIFCLILLACNADAQIGQWESRTPMYTKRSTHVGFSIHGKGYICAGAPDDQTNLKDLWQYDPNTNAWSQKADMPGVGRQELSCFTIDSFAYVGLGRNIDNPQTAFSSFNRYDPSSNTWSAIADFPSERYVSTGFSIDSIGYITCGVTPLVERYKDLYAYNPRTDKWTKKAGLPEAAIVRAFACVVSNGKNAYLMGGFDGYDIANDFYMYDPLNDTWTPKEGFPGGARSYSAGFAIGKYILMGMGRDGSQDDAKDWYYYNPDENLWAAVASHPNDNTVGCATFVIDGKGYVSGGFSASSNSVFNLMNVLTATPVSIDEPYKKEKPVLKPYLANSSSILYCNAFKGDFDLVIYDIAGKIVYQSRTISEDGEQMIFDLSEMIEGRYIAYINNAGIKKSLKILLP